MTDRLVSRPGVLAAVLAPFALLLGYVLARFGSAAAIVLVALPVAGSVLLRQRLNGLLCGLLLITVIPYWYTFGSSTAADFRVASALALLTCFWPFRTRLATTDLAVLAVAVVATLGWLLQDNQPGVGKIVLNELLPFAFYMAARTVASDAVPRVMMVAFGTGALGALTVFYETLLGRVVFADPTSYSWNATDATIFRPGGVFGSPPGAATVLALTAICGLPLLRDAFGWRLRLARGAFLVTVVASILTFTRASILGLAAGAAVYLWLARSPMLSPRRLVIGGALVIAGALLALPRVEGSSVYQQGVVRPGNLAARTAIWRLALPIVEASPRNAIFGIGSEATLAPRLDASVPAALASSPVLVDHGTHNQYVLAVLEEGLLGLAVLVAWVAATICTGLRGRRDTDPASAALTGAMVAFAIIMLANNALLHPPSVAVAAMASGLLLARRMNPGSS